MAEAPLPSQAPYCRNTQRGTRHERWAAEIAAFYRAVELWEGGGRRGGGGRLCQPAAGDDGVVTDLVTD